jgi:hypothetical protein
VTNLQAKHRRKLFTREFFHHWLVQTGWAWLFLSAGFLVGAWHR